MRLPTEAEWEYAARAGSTAGRNSDLNTVAWYDGNSGSKTHEVSQKQANNWGLLDTLGNVWEWVADCYANYPSGAALDPTGPASGTSRALRGGSWNCNPRLARVSIHAAFGPAVRDGYFGLRCTGNVLP